MNSSGPISGLTSAIINSEIKDKNSRYIIAHDISGKDNIDANGDNQVTVEEIKKAANHAGINTDNLSNDQLNQLAQDAVELTAFLKTGGNISRQTTSENFNYEFVGDMINTPSIQDVKSNSSVNPPNDCIFRRGQSGPEIAKLNILLANLGFKVEKDNEDKFTDATEKFVKDFQKNNNLLDNLFTGLPLENMIPGIIDSKTLKAMEQSVKAENPYIPVDNKIKEIKTEYESARQKVKDQLQEKGIDPLKAFSTGEKLAEGAVGVDRKMGSQKLCYTAVKTTLEKVLGMPYERFGKVKNPETGKTEHGEYAKTAGYTMLSKHPELFTKLEGFSRNDVQFLPPGAIVVYRPISSTGKELTGEAGHIGIQSMQVKGLPVIGVQEKDGKIIQVTVKNKDNSLKSYDVIDDHAVLSKPITDRNELAAGKKLNGLTISSVEEKNGVITSVTVKGYSKEKGSFNKTYQVKDNNIILEKYNLEHADISDKMRFKPWSNAKIEVYFPK